MGIGGTGVGRRWQSVGMGMRDGHTRASNSRARMRRQPRGSSSQTCIATCRYLAGFVATCGEPAAPAAAAAASRGGSMGVLGAGSVRGGRWDRWWDCKWNGQWDR